MKSRGVKPIDPVTDTPRERAVLAIAFSLTAAFVLAACWSWLVSL